MLENSISQSIISTEEFLNAIHGENSLIYFNVGSKTWSNKLQTYAAAKSKLQWLNEHKQQDICFIVNAGGTKNSQIITINAAFGDWDCGKDENGNYFPIEIVKEKKDEFLQKIQQFPLKPTYIVETRNGYQIYWLLYSGTTAAQFISLQKKLACYFQSDPAVINPARVMRLPGYNWIKAHTHCPPFYVYITAYNNCRYYHSDLFSLFSSVSDSDYEEYKKQVTTQSRKPERKSAHNNNDSYYKDRTCSIYVGTSPQDSLQEVVVGSMTEAIEYIKRRSPAKYLQIETQEDNNITLPCPFHEDTTPSAHLYKYEEDQYYYLKCHSSVCNYGPATILDVVMKQKDCDCKAAIDIMIEYYHIKIDNSWKKEQERIVTENITIIDHIADYQEKYPNLYKCINRIKTDLLSKLKFAQEHITFQSYRGEYLFVCSLREFEKIRSNGCHVEGDPGRQNERVDRYCLLGLLRKLPDDEIPELLLNNAKEQRRILQQQSKVDKEVVNMPRTQFYSIPAYTEVILSQADKIAKILYDKGIRMNAISRDVIYDIFGKEKTQEIYPQIHTKETSKNGNHFKNKVETILVADMENKGYSSVGHILDEIRKEYNWKSVTDRRVKKYIPGLLVKHNVVEVVTNKNLKGQYGIASKGYPRIIVKCPGITDNVGVVPPDASKTVQIGPG